MNQMYDYTRSFLCRRMSPALPSFEKLLRKYQGLSELRADVEIRLWEHLCPSYAICLRQLYRPLDAMDPLSVPDLEKPITSAHRAVSLNQSDRFRPAWLETNRRMDPKPAIYLVMRRGIKRSVWYGKLIWLRQARMRVSNHKSRVIIATRLYWNLWAECSHQHELDATMVTKQTKTFLTPEQIVLGWITASYMKTTWLIGCQIKFE